LAPSIRRGREISLLEHGTLPEHLAHTDGNTLRRIAEA
jgi:hypothetical protein